MTNLGTIPVAATRRGPIPALAGIGLRAPHHRALLDARPAVGFVEAHSENYMCAGGPLLYYLEQTRRDYPLSLHGVALSLGSAERPDRDHLRRIRDLIDRFQPCLVSEHLAWTGAGGVYLNDLLPLPYDQATLDQVAGNVAAAQDALGRTILIENPSSYLRFRRSELAEPEFLAELAGRTGCGLLLDVNNVAVSAFNLGFDPHAYLAAIPAAAIGQFHLAGHSVNDVGDALVRIDDHGSRVTDEVWDLYAMAVARFGPRPTLIEWDSNLPPLDVLVAEAATADARAARARGLVHAGVR
ncbi:MAG: MNIO family bufferin maturase [Alphaproteobacteria bacterium]